MIAHIFKLIWNRRKKNGLLMLEIFFSFLVLFGLFTLLADYLGNYALPRGFDHHNVWAINIAGKGVTHAERQEKLILLKQQLRAFPWIEETAFMSSNYPFAMTKWNMGIGDSTKEYLFNSFYAEPSIVEVLKIPIAEGEVLGRRTGGQNYEVLANRKFTEQLPDPTAAVGYKINDDDGGEALAYHICGVIEHFRYYSSFMEDEESLFVLHHMTDSTQAAHWSNLLVRVQPGTDRAQEREMLDRLESLFPEADFTCTELEELRASKDKLILMPIVIVSVLGLFLLLSDRFGR